MRWIVLVVVAACGSHKPEPAPPDLPGSCGTTTCIGSDICIEIETGPGTPNVATHTDYSYRCSPIFETDTKYRCSPPQNGRQHCVALVPAAPR
jgi:hypothetical protein